MEKNEIMYEEYEVYSALLREKFLKDCERKLCIDELTFDGDLSESIGTLSFRTGKVMPEMEAIRDFKDNNKEPSKIESEKISGIDYMVFGAKDYVKVFDENDEGWDFFHDTYKMEEIITLSRVGFNADKTQAVLYQSFQAGQLAGQGFYVKMAKVKGNWEIEEEHSLWIS